jgi:hypothetical protein
MAKRLVLAYAETSEPANWYSLLGQSYSRLAMWEPAEYWLKRAERDAQDEFDWPGLTPLKLLALQGRYTEMAQALRTTLASADGERLSREAASEYGTLQALVGDYRGAIQTLAPHMNLEASSADAGNANARHALAWAYLNTGAADRAHTILREVEQQYRGAQSKGWLHLSPDLAMFAQNAVLTGERELAIDRLRQAVEAGWRDYYAVHHDPRWQSLSDEPRFKALLATVRADIDAQRAR